MSQKTVFAVLSVLFVSAPLLGQPQVPGAAASPQCVPAAQPSAEAGGRRGPGAPGQPQPGQPGRGPAPQRIPRDVTVTPIPGVVSAGRRQVPYFSINGSE